MMEINVAMMPGVIIIGITLGLLLTVYICMRKKPSYSISRMFLKKEVTLRAFKLITMGMVALAVSRIIHAGYMLSVINRDVYVAYTFASGLFLSACLIAAFYTILKIIK